MCFGNLWDLHGLSFSHYDFYGWQMISGAWRFFAKEKNNEKLWKCLKLTFQTFLPAQTNFSIEIFLPVKSFLCCFC